MISAMQTTYRLSFKIVNCPFYEMDLLLLTKLGASYYCRKTNLKKKIKNRILFQKNVCFVLLLKFKLCCIVNLFQMNTCKSRGLILKYVHSP